MSRNAMDASIDAENARDDQRETARREWLESVKPRHMVGFTPGPWRADGLFVRSDRGDYVCDIKFPDDDPEVIANARLIAAAPELVEALRCASNVLSLLSDEVKALGCKAENVPEKVRAALAKAGVV